MPIFDHLKIREKFLSPQEVINTLDIKNEEVVIDFGCGPGFWTIPFAKKVGVKGLVIAIDEFEPNLKFIKAKADRIGLDNIKYIKAKYASTAIPTNEKADCILISNILSLTKNDNELIISASNNAKNGTKLVVIDWDIKSVFCPKEDIRVNKEQVIVSAKKAGFTFKKLLETGTHHFGLYFEYEGGNK